MVNYIVHLEDGRDVSVRAETYQESDRKLLFYIEGKPIADIYFDASVVVGVSIGDAEVSSKNDTPSYQNTLDAFDLKILKLIHDSHPQRFEIGEIESATGIPLRDVGYSLQKLSSNGFISPPPNFKKLWYPGQQNPNGYRVLNPGIERVRKLANLNNSALDSDKDAV